MAMQRMVTAAPITTVRSVGSLVTAMWRVDGRALGLPAYVLRAGTEKKKGRKNAMTAIPPHWMGVRDVRLRVGIPAQELNRASARKCAGMGRKRRWKGVMMATPIQMTGALMDVMRRPDSPVPGPRRVCARTAGMEEKKGQKDVTTELAILEMDAPISVLWRPVGHVQGSTQASAHVLPPPLCPPSLRPPLQAEPLRSFPPQAPLPPYRAVL